MVVWRLGYCIVLKPAPWSQKNEGGSSELRLYSLSGCDLILLYISCSYLILFQELAVITRFFVYICDSTARDVFLGVLYGYKGVLQVRESPRRV